MEHMADRIRRDVETSLNRNFNTWDLLDYTLPTDTENSYYRMKIRTDDNGHVKVKTAEKEPGKDWDVHIEEYDKGKPGLTQGTSNQPKALGQQEQQSQGNINQSTNNTNLATTASTNKSDFDTPVLGTFGNELATFDEPFRKMWGFADNIKKQVESQLNRTFNTWDLLDYTPSIDPKDSYYRMKIKTDDNGHVRVKTVEKEPGKQPEVHVEEYDKGTAIEEEKPSERGSAITQGSQSTQATTTGPDQA